MINDSAQPETLNLLREKTRHRLVQFAAEPRGILGIAALDLTNGDFFGVNENASFSQASAIKIPLLMEVYKQAKARKFKLTDRRRIEKEDKSSGSGVLQELGDGSVEMSIYDLCVLTILVSDNTATNIVIDLVGLESVNDTLASLGFTKTRLNRKMRDMTALRNGVDNVSTPAEAVRIMALLHRGEFIDRATCDAILDICKKIKPSGVGGIKSAVPPEVPVAFKGGSLPGVKTEWGIVYCRNRPYAVAMMESYGIGEELTKIAKQISKELYEYFWRVGQATASGTYLPAK